VDLDCAGGQLQARGVDLVVVDQGIDTCAAVGRMFFQILGAIAEFEHALMSERIIDGLAAPGPVAALAGRNRSSPRSSVHLSNRHTTPRRSDDSRRRTTQFHPSAGRPVGDM
jgi:DNA invertase Pin-like site-specific DNA recombinase